MRTVAYISAFALAATVSGTAGQANAFFGHGRKTEEVRVANLQQEHDAEAQQPTRALIDYATGEYPGTLIINTSERALYLVMEGNKALRYSIGVGREGFEWRGTETVTRKSEWPAWRPPAEMRERQPYLPQFVPGGPNNPLGARALYLGNSLYRIHGTNEDWTIGKAVSSGCIRLRNEDIVDLYRRVPVGAKVVVL